MQTDNSIAAIYSFDRHLHIKRPLFQSTVAAGFPSPADDYIEQQLDLNEHLVQNPAATFFVRVAGESMVGAGIHDGDILVVDRSVEVVNGRVVIAIIDGELTVKRLQKSNNSCVLAAENTSYPDIEISPEQGLEIWGVAIYAIHKL